MRLITLLLTVLFINIFSHFGLCRARNERPISLQSNNLSKWRTAHEASAIQSSLRNQRIPDKIPFDIKHGISFTKPPFLLLEAESNPLGGFFALVVFKKYPKLLRLWVYETDKDVFEIREIEIIRNLNNQVMDALGDIGLSTFWIPPR